VAALYIYINVRCMSFVRVILTYHLRMYVGIYRTYSASWLD